MDIIMDFEGVESAFYLWINGKRVGYSEDSRLPAHFNISPYLKKGKNRLALKVFRFSDGSYLEDQDYWKYSGIERSVFIQARPKSRLNDYVLGNALINHYKDGNFTLDVSMMQPQKGQKVEVKVLTAAGKALYAQKPDHRIGYRHVAPFRQCDQGGAALERRAALPSTRSSSTPPTRTDGCRRAWRSPSGSAPWR